MLGKDVPCPVPEGSKVWANVPGWGWGWSTNGYTKLPEPNMKYWYAVPFAEPAITWAPPEHIKIESWPTVRPGGQHVGIVSKGVRVTHLPTDTQVIVTCERSQLKNRNLALSMLEWGLTEMQP